MWEFESTCLVLMPDRSLAMWALPTSSIRKFVPHTMARLTCLTPWPATWVPADIPGV